MSWQDDVQDRVNGVGGTTLFASMYNGFKNAFLNHKARHITGGEDIIPVATTAATGLCPVLDGFSGHYLSGTGVFSTPSGSGGGGGTGTIYLYPLSAMIPLSSPDADTLGEEPIDQLETSGGANYVYGAFSSTITNWLQWRFGIPNDWDGGAVMVTIAWLSPSDETGYDVKWVVKSNRTIQGSSINTTPNTVLAVTGTVGGGSLGPYIDETTPTSATLGTSGNEVILALYRDWAIETSGPTYARLLWIKIEYNKS